jgi:hypothetical protein
MKFLPLFSFLFLSLLVRGQELPSQVYILKVYPFSAIKDEFRVGIEKQIKENESLELGVGYAFKTYERNNCKECYFFLPAYFSAYSGNGIRVRLNWNTYHNTKNSLAGSYTSVGLIYKFMLVDKPNFVPSGPTLPDGYYYSKQHAVSLQGLIGKQYIKSSFVYNIYGGLSIAGQWNYYHFFGAPFASYQDNLKKNPALHFGVNVHLCISFGYKYDKRKP